MDYTIIGKITNSHGIRGDIKIFPLTDDPERFFQLKEIFVGEKKELVSISDAKLHKGLVLIHFKGLDNINDILKYKDEFVYIKDEDRVTLPKDHYFISDLIGCNVILKDGSRIGIIKDVLQGIANDVYIVKSKDDKEYMIPAVGEFIVSVDIQNKEITIDPIEGMIEWK